MAVAPSNREFTIWTAFPQFGIGVDADAKVRGGGPGGGDIVLDVSLTTRGQPKANLSWTGGSTANVDIYRNNSVLTTTSNSGSYTDNLRNQRSGPFTYKVCEEGSTTTCSNEVIVTP